MDTTSEPEVRTAQAGYNSGFAARRLLTSANEDVNVIDMAF